VVVVVVVIVAVMLSAQLLNLPHLKLTSRITHQSRQLSVLKLLVAEDSWFIRCHCVPNLSEMFNVSLSCYIGKWRYKK